MTKTMLFSALKTVIDTNCINLDTMKWVERVPNTKEKKKVNRNWDDKVSDGEMSFRRSFIDYIIVL